MIRLCKCRRVSVLVCVTLTALKTKLIMKLVTAFFGCVMRFYEMKTAYERTELHNVITQDDEKAIKGEIKNIKRITNAGNAVTGEVAVVMSRNVCVSIFV